MSREAVEWLESSGRGTPRRQISHIPAGLFQLREDLYCEGHVCMCYPAPAYPLSMEWTQEREDRWLRDAHEPWVRLPEGFVVTPNNQEWG